MYSEDNNQKAIKDRLMDNVSDDISKVEGSFIYDSLVPMSYEIELGYKNLDDFLDLMFAPTSRGEYLKLRASEFGVDKRMGTKAIAEVEFTGSNDITIPSETEVQTESGLSYYTQEEVLIDSSGTVLVDAIAEDVGTEYNVPANKITHIPEQIIGVDSVTNPESVDNGVNEESDEELLGRLLDKVQEPSTSGNPLHYEEWALEIDDINDVKIFPLWDGEGTVQIVAIDNDKTAVSSSVIDNLQEHIDEQRPIGAVVTCVSATTLDINVEVDVVVTSDSTLEEVETEIEQGVKEYLKEIAFKQDYASYAYIGNAVLESEGVRDYDNLLVNDSQGNISIGDKEVAELGSLVVNSV